MVEERVVDKRSGKFKLIEPFRPLIPEGVTNTIYDIVDENGRVIGNLELGTDGFLQALILDKGYVLKLKRHPEDGQVRCFFKHVGGVKRD